MSKTEQHDPGWISQAPINFERQIEIAAKPAAIWQHLAVNETWVEWYPGCKECNFITEAPHGVDSLRYVHLDNFKVQERITRWEPNERWGMTVVEINAPVVAAMAEEIELLPAGDATIVRWRIGVELTWLGRPLRRPLVKKSAAGLETALSLLSARATASAVDA